MRPQISIELALLLILGTIIGFVMAIMANGFVEGVSSAANLRQSYELFQFTVAGKTYSAMSLFTLLVAASVVIALRRTLKLDGWAGPADSILAAHTDSSDVDVRKGLASTLAAFTSAAGGGSVGQYGPLVHFGATVGSLFKKVGLAKISGDVFLGCGVAAAISAGFNAPLAGVIFAHEAVLRHFSLRAVAPIFIASISASSFDQQLFPSNESTFQTVSNAPPLIQSVPYLIISGILFAGLALVFMLALRYATSAGKKIQSKNIEAPIVAAIVCGTIGIFVPEILGIGIGVVNDLFQGSFSGGYIALMLVLKITMTAMCIGFGLFGGVFSPALFIGVSAGAIVSIILSFSPIAGFNQVMMIAGMAAVSSSVIGAPISVILIVLELTGSYDYAVSAMVAVIVSSLITHRVFGLSYFDRQLKDRGVDMSLGREDIQLSRTLLRNFISQDCITADASDLGVELTNRMSKMKMTEAYILGRDQVLLGKVDIFGAQKAEANPIATELIKDPLILKDTDSLKTALLSIESFVGESVPIVNENGVFLGMLTEGMLFSAASSVKAAITKLEKE